VREPSSAETSTDEALMQRYAEGDVRALPELFRRHAPRIHAFFARSFRDASACEDLLQTTFLKLHTSRASFDATQSFRAWLYGLASRVRVDELRRRYRAKGRGEIALDELPAADEPGTRASADDHHLALRVRRALDALPESQRLVVMLHRFEGLSFGEIAEVMASIEGVALTEGAMRIRAFRAFAALRDATLGPDLAEGVTP
jgi:RNA polymerase sigma factor (sigma-70 family)